MQISHGAMLAIAEISLALYKTGNAEIISLYYATQDTTSLTSIVSNLPPRSLTTFGSEHAREAACHLITCLATTQIIPKEEHLLKDWKQVIQTSLERKEENVQEFAVLAFGAVAMYYGLEKEEVDVALKKIEIHNNPQKYGRRGYALALGMIDYTKHPEYLHDVLIQLCKASQYQEEHQPNDAESKRNAVLGLANIMQNLGDTIKSGKKLDIF